MIKKLRIKFAIIAMLAITIVTISIFGIIAIDNRVQMNEQIDEIIGIIIDNDGTIPKKDYNNKSNPYINEETRFTTRFFTAKIDDYGNIEDIYIDNISSVSESEAEEIINNIISKKKTSGNLENFRYGMSSDKKLVVVVDTTMQNKNQRNFIKKASMIVIIGLIVTFMMIYILSERAIKPTIDAFYKQREFISNAGHDLKTPVAIILADVEVLEIQDGKNNEFVKSIKNQANRLNTLINTLLGLARLDERDNKPNFIKFSLSDVVKEEIQEMKPLAKDKEIECNIADNIEVNADKESIKQLITILIDNSIKYVDENGKISIMVDKQGKYARFEISNTYKNAKEIDKKKIFDRFYREDKSRNSKKDGHGIGLSMAKSIVEMNKGKIYVANKEDEVCFVVLI